MELDRMAKSVKIRTAHPAHNLGSIVNEIGHNEILWTSHLVQNEQCTILVADGLHCLCGLRKATRS